LPGSRQAMLSGNSSQPPVQLSSRMQAKIKEAELYLGQGLFAEARQIYQELLNKLGAVPAGSVVAFRSFLQEKVAIVNREEAKFLGTPLPPEPLPGEEAPEGEEAAEGASHFERGELLLSKGQLTEAIEEFRNAAELGYKPAECALHVAKSHTALGQHQDAIRLLQGSLDLPDIDDGDRGRFLEQLAVATEAARKEKKRPGPEKPAAASPPPRPTPPAIPVREGKEESFRHRLNMAKLHLKNRQFLKAVQQLRQLRGEPEVPPAQLIATYEQILQKDPQNLDALGDLAEIAAAANSLTQAAAYLERIQEIAPEDGWSQDQLIDVYRGLLETAEASEEMRLKLARHLLRADRVDDAVEEYVEVLLADAPGKLSILVELGEVLLERQDYDRILELLGDALPWVESGAEGPEILRYYSILGRASEEKNLPDEAQEYYRRAAAIDPQAQAIRDKATVHDAGPLVSRVKSFLGSQPAAARQYAIGEKLGEDEIHEIFRVTETSSGTVRVAKTLLPQLATRDGVKEFVRRWSYEQVAMENRNVVRILDVAERKQRFYFVSDDFETTLAALLSEKGSLPISAAVRLARALLNALAYAHSHRGTDDTLRKIFHLCLNPNRIWITGDLTKARVADLGLAFLLDSVLAWHPDYRERSPGELAYLAPEQFDRSPAKMPDKIKQAVDIYTFGVVFYQVLTGHLPFSGPSPEDFCKQHNEKYPVPPRVFISTIPAKIDELVLKCLHKDPKKRWRTPTEIDLALEKINLNE
jgi:tetratricopeptide (TPR) repeat protein